MSNKNYRTLDGLYKAILKLKKNYAYDYAVQKNDTDIDIFNAEDFQGAISGMLIEDLMPVLKRSSWMIHHCSFPDRIELVVWIDDCNK